MSGSAAKCIILQTSDSSDDDENTRQPAQVPFLVTGQELAGQDTTTTIRPNARSPLASSVPQNTNNSTSSKTVPQQAKRVKRTAGIENMKQVPGQTHQVPIAASGSKSTATERHAENHTLCELQKTNELLVHLVGRMKKTKQHAQCQK